jgi:hypothetical protein
MLTASRNVVTTAADVVDANTDPNIEPFLTAHGPELVASTDRAARRREGGKDAVACGLDDRAAPTTHDIVHAGMFVCDHALRGMRVIDACVPNVGRT